VTAWLVSVLILPAVTVSLPPVSQQGQPPKQSILKQIVPNPTGNNGYEEYLMACDVVRDGQLRIFTDSTPESFEATIQRYEAKPPANMTTDQKELFEDEKPSLKEYETAKKYRSYTVLQLRREAMARAGKALDLVNRGNRKPVYDPRGKVDSDTLYPEYAYMRNVAKLAAAGAYIAFADGQSSRGTQYLCDALIMGQNISEGTLIARLVAVSVQSIVFASFEKFLPNLSVTDALQLEALAPRLIGNPPLAVRTIEKEFQFISNSIEQIFKKTNEESSWIADDEEASVAQLSALEFMKKASPIEQQQVIDLCKKRMARNREALIASYQRPESQWDFFDGQEESEFDSKRRIQSAGDLAEYLSEMVSPVFSQIGRVEITNRTQIRLLGLAGSVIRFRWEHDRWPTKLAEAVGTKAVTDPVGGEQFQYELVGNGFRVYSRGTKSTGEIALQYKRNPSGQGEAPPP
jgi:hypothetical protein